MVSGNGHVGIGREPSDLYSLWVDGDIFINGEIDSISYLFSFDLDVFDRVISERTKMIILNSPGNLDCEWLSDSFPCVPAR